MAGISWSDTTVTVIENATVDVCLEGVMEELETTITVEISVVPGTAREGMYMYMCACVYIYYIHMYILL